MYLPVKALHIIFVVTWFAGLFYLVRLFIYNREACDRPEAERTVLQAQFGLMMRRLWYAITWPSCVLALVTGTWLALSSGSLPWWLVVKIGLVLLLFLYHLSLGVLLSAQLKGRFEHSSSQLRMWNEVATVFLVAIVFIVVMKSTLSWIWYTTSMILLSVVLAVVIKRLAARRR